VIWSIISMAAGVTPRCNTSVTARQAAPTSSKMASTVRTPSGRGQRRTRIFVAMPNVPSDPTNADTRSGPGASCTALPSCVTLPSGSTTSSARMWLVVTPYLSVCGPPLFSATLPPMVQAFWLEGSGA
jgi:hypothetical protein